MRNRKTYEKMERPFPGDRCWNQKRLINLIAEVDHNDDLRKNTGK
jgi:hypothetical protein